MEADDNTFDMDEAVSEAPRSPGTDASATPREVVTKSTAATPTWATGSRARAKRDLVVRQSADLESAKNRTSIKEGSIVRVLAQRVLYDGTPRVLVALEEQARNRKGRVEGWVTCQKDGESFLEDDTPEPPPTEPQHLRTPRVHTRVAPSLQRIANLDTLSRAAATRERLAPSPPPSPKTPRPPLPSPPSKSKLKTAGSEMMEMLSAGAEGRRARPAFAVAAEAFEEAGKAARAITPRDGYPAPLSARLAEAETRVARVEALAAEAEALAAAELEAEPHSRDVEAEALPPSPTTQMVKSLLQPVDAPVDAPPQQTEPPPPSTPTTINARSIPTLDTSMNTPPPGRVVTTAVSKADVAAMIHLQAKAEIGRRARQEASVLQHQRASQHAGFAQHGKELKARLNEERSYRRSGERATPRGGAVATPRQQAAKVGDQTRMERADMRARRVEQQQIWQAHGRELISEASQLSARNSARRSHTSTEAGEQSKAQEVSDFRRAMRQVSEQAKELRKEEVAASQQRVHAIREGHTMNANAKQGAFAARVAGAHGTREVVAEWRKERNVNTQVYLEGAAALRARIGLDVKGDDMRISHLIEKRQDAAGQRARGRMMRNSIASSRDDTLRSNRANVDAVKAAKTVALDTPSASVSAMTSATVAPRMPPTTPRTPVALSARTPRTPRTPGALSAAGTNGVSTSSSSATASAMAAVVESMSEKFFAFRKRGVPWYQHGKSKGPTERNQTPPASDNGTQVVI